MRIAVVGGGISGMAAAYALQSFADVTLFEANHRLGGHTDTHNILVGARTYAVDSGFIVFNRANYPLFSAWLDELGVACKPSDMSFSVRLADTEYGTSSIGTLFCDRRNAVRPRFLNMLRGIRRFYREAHRVAETDRRTLGEFLAEERYPAPFAADHLLPMCAALWSAPLGEARELSIAHVAAFMANHGLLQLRRRPQWRVVDGGSSSYVEAFRSRCGAALRLGQPVRRVLRDAGGVRIATASGTERFDQVVLAVHADQALALIEPTPAERAVLGALQYRSNRAVVHSDARAMPRSRAAWSSWNVSADATSGCEITYWMNRLQGLGKEQRFFVSLNPERPLDRVWVEREYAHPVCTPAARAAQRRRGEISGANRTHYCGAYWGWGFHEDGFKSAVEVAECLRTEVRRAA